MKTLIAIIIITLLAGCASTPAEPRLVVQRVEAWKAADGKIHLRSVEVARNELNITAAPPTSKQFGSYFPQLFDCVEVQP